MIDDTNVTTNSRWHVAHNIRQTVTNMSDTEKQHALEAIQTQTLFGNHQQFGATPNPAILKYVTTLLKGKKPEKGISKKSCHDVLTTKSKL